MKDRLSHLDPVRMLGGLVRIVNQLKKVGFFLVPPV